MVDNESIAPEELATLGEIETKVKSNGAYHVEDVNDMLLEEIKVRGTIGMSTAGMGSSSQAFIKRQGLKKWRRMPRELGKKAGNNLVGRNNGDLTVSTAEIEQGSNGFVVNINGNSPRMKHEISSLNERNSGLSFLPNDQQRNGQIGTSKKARGFIMDQENSHSSISMGFDFESTEFVFVQGTNSVASKGRLRGGFTKYEEEYSDDADHADKQLNEEEGTEFIKNDAESEDDFQADVAAEGSSGVKEDKHEGLMDQDALVESLTGLRSAHEELDREVQKWRDVGKDDLPIFDESIRDILELKDSKISELESALSFGPAKTELDDLLKKIIQVDVESVVITTMTKRLTEGLLHELKLSLPQKKAPSQEAMQSPKKQPEKLETTEDVKKLQNRVRIFTSFLMIQLILLLITLYLKFFSHKVDIVPT